MTTKLFDLILILILIGIALYHEYKAEWDIANNSLLWAGLIYMTWINKRKN